MKKPAQLHTDRNMKQPVVTLCSWTVEGTAMCLGISCGQQFEQNAAVCRLLARVCSVTTADHTQPVKPLNRLLIYLLAPWS